MTRSIIIFLATFVTGALAALVTRAALFNPHAGHEGHPAGGGEYAPMVSNPLTPAASKSAPPSASANPEAAKAPDPHASHDASTTKASSERDKPVNTVCAICGMPVDPTIPTVEYQGNTIGFGCKMCPPKFKADPDRWGPIYLKDEPLKR